MTHFLKLYMIVHYSTVSTIPRRVRRRAARSEEGSFRRVSLNGACLTWAQLC